MSLSPLATSVLAMVVAGFGAFQMKVPACKVIAEVILEVGIVDEGPAESDI